MKYIIRKYIGLRGISPSYICQASKISGDYIMIGVNGYLNYELSAAITLSSGMPSRFRPKGFNYENTAAFFIDRCTRYMDVGSCLNMRRGHDFHERVKHRMISLWSHMTTYSIATLIKWPWAFSRIIIATSSVCFITIDTKQSTAVQKSSLEVIYKGNE